MTTKENIINTIEIHKSGLIPYGVRKIGLFGSYARGEQTAQSDIDILAEFEEPVSLLALVGAEQYLSRILKTKVDLIPKEDIRPELKDKILAEAVTV